VYDSLESMKFSQDIERDGILRIISIILYLGNIEFDDSTYDGSKPVKVLQNDAFNKICLVLKCD
jgi:myosin heavy subunit